LKEVNAQWEKHRELSPSGLISFTSDADRIQYHLKLVARHLKKSSDQFWNEYQLKNRSQLIELLEKYAERKIFPTNLYHSTRTPYFIDDFGVHCAVGYLIEQSGHDELALEISEEFNYDYIENINSSRMLEFVVPKSIPIIFPIVLKFYIIEHHPKVNLYAMRFFGNVSEKLLVIKQ
jgi:hypothetical protein